jgi:hypothetical protein
MPLYLGIPTETLYPQVERDNISHNTNRYSLGRTLLQTNLVTSTSQFVSLVSGYPW